LEGDQPRAAGSPDGSYTKKRTLNGTLFLVVPQFEIYDPRDVGAVKPAHVR
jgi:hypothetical protein